MYIRNGQPFDIFQFQVIGENQYPAGYFLGDSERSKFSIFEVPTPTPPTTTSDKKVVLTSFSNVGGNWVPQWSVVSKTQAEIDKDTYDLSVAKVAKNSQINAWREQANLTSFPFNGKVVACDALSRSDIDAVAGHISLFGTLPAGFPGAWKAVDNTLIYPMDIVVFKSMYAAMTAQGTTNFNKSQTLKTALATATKIEEVDAINWN